MASKNLLEENIDKLTQTNSSLEILIRESSYDDVTFCRARNGELNLKKLKKGEVHSNKSPSKEAEEWFASLDLEKVNVLYVYGVGLGYYYDAAKKWLRGDSERYLVFLEDDPGVLRRLLEIDQGTDLFCDKQVQLHYMGEGQEGEIKYGWLGKFFVRLKIEVSALESYQKAYAEAFLKMKTRLFHDSDRESALAAEYLEFSEGFFINFYSNILDWNKASHGNGLFGKFHQVPAIICGAGPSLNKNKELLSTLSDRALIFSGGSSLNALSAQNFRPHFGAGVDPNLSQFSRLINNTAYEVPFFYRNRICYLALRAVHGPRLYLNGCGGYFVSEWFEEKFNVKGTSIEEGFSVINMNLEIARILGCNPIIFVGMDLAYTDMKLYAEGVIADPQIKEAAICEEAFLRPDIQGNPVYTEWKWVRESEWTSDYAKRYSELSFINATEGGIGFPGIPNATLNEVVKKHLKESYDLSGRIHAEIQNAYLSQLTEEEVVEGIRELKESLKRSISLCDAMQGELNGIEAGGRLQTGKTSLIEVELSEEPAFQYILSSMATVHSNMLQRKYSQPAASLYREKYAFIKQAAKINIKVMEGILKKNHSGCKVRYHCEQRKIRDR